MLVPRDIEVRVLNLRQYFLMDTDSRKVECLKPIHDSPYIGRLVKEKIKIDAEKW